MGKIELSGQRVRFAYRTYGKVYDFPRSVVTDGDGVVGGWLAHGFGELVVVKARGRTEPESVGFSIGALYRPNWVDLGRVSRCLPLSGLVDR